MHGAAPANPDGEHVSLLRPKGEAPPPSEVDDSDGASVGHGGGGGGRVGGWWTPPVILGFLLLINALIYFDRGAISVTVPYIKNDTLVAGYPEHQLTGGQTGLLGSAFMGGYMVFCPFFAVLANHVAPTKLMAIGTAGWLLSALSISVSTNYPWLLLSRVMVGIGEASFTGLAPSTVDNIAPLASKTLWLGLFFAAIPVGQAIGIAAGGLIAQWGPFTIFGAHVAGWRTVFFVEALLMAPLSALCWVLPVDVNKKPPEKETAAHPLGAPDHVYQAHEALQALLGNPTWLCTSLGFAAYTFVIGALAFWGPTLVSEPPLAMQPAVGSTLFGIVTAVCGFAGTAAGGLISDWVGGGISGNLRHVAISLLLSFPCGLLCFYTSSPFGFFASLAVVELILFNTQAPVNAVLLDCVPTSLRNFSMSFNVLIIHLLGDTPSPYLVGQLSDWLRPSHGASSLHAALVLCYLWLLFGVLFYFAAWQVQSRWGRPRLQYGVVP